MDVLNHAEVSPLQLAVDTNDKELAKLLLDNGATVDYKPPAGWTPLHFAAKHGRLEVARVLLEAGAQVDWVHANHGWTPLFHSVVMHNLAMAKLLVECGADIHWKTSEDDTSVMQRAEREGLLVVPGWRRLFNI